MKRTKLIASLMMCVFCLTFLVVGVWAAVSTVNFNLNGNLKYYPEGVYVELSGQVYRGRDENSMSALTSDPRFTLQPQANFDNSTGEPSGNFPIEDWDIGNLTFTPVLRCIKVEVKITNYSEFAIVGSPVISLNNTIIDITHIPDDYLQYRYFVEVVGKNANIMDFRSSNGFIPCELICDLTRNNMNAIDLDVDEFKVFQSKYLI